MHSLDHNPEECEGCSATTMYGTCECGIRNRMLTLSKIAQRLLDATQGFSPIESGDDPFSLLSTAESRGRTMEQFLSQHPYHQLFPVPLDMDLLAQEPNRHPPLSSMSPITMQFDIQKTPSRQRISTNMKVDSLWELSKRTTHGGMEILRSLQSQRQAIIMRQQEAIPILDRPVCDISHQLSEGLELLKMGFSSTVEKLTRQGIDQLLYNESLTDLHKPSARFSKEIKQILNESFVSRSPYPSEDEKERLSRLCKLDYKQVSVWFANKRMRTKIHSPTSKLNSVYPTRKPKHIGNLKFESDQYFYPDYEELTPSDISFSGSPFTESSMDSIGSDSFSPINTPSPSFPGCESCLLGCPDSTAHNYFNCELITSMVVMQSAESGYLENDIQARLFHEQQELSTPPSSNSEGNQSPLELISKYRHNEDLTSSDTAQNALLVDFISTNSPGDSQNTRSTVPHESPDVSSKIFELPDASCNLSPKSMALTVDPRIFRPETTNI